MKQIRSIAPAILLVLQGPVAAQDITVSSSDSPAPVAAQLRGTAPEAQLQANTEILLRLNEELNSRRSREGDMFSLSVIHDVMLGDFIVIPRGSRAVGEVTWRTGKGAFGKSGKMDIALRYIDLDGRRIPLEGTYRQEGEGNTVATVAGVIAAGVFAGFITGRSARIPQGRELTAHTAEAIPVALPAGHSLEAAGIQARMPDAVSDPAPVSEAVPPATGSLASYPENPS